MTTIGALRKKVALPARAELREDCDSGKWDVYVKDKWIGGLPFDDEKPFYTAESIYAKLAPKVYKGGTYDQIMQESQPPSK